MGKVEVINDFVSHEDCDTIIKYLDENENSPDFPQLRYRNNHELRKTFVDPNSLEIGNIVLKYADKLNYGSSYFVAEYFLSLFRPGYEMHMHQDVVGDIDFTHSIVLYLNDNFKGGELLIPELDFKHKPKRGDAVIFSPNTLTHGVTEVIGGNRYTVPFWLTDKEKFKSKFLYSKSL
jgi:hypothetical protein